MDLHQGKIAELPRRGVVSVGGAEAAKLLSGLITVDVADVGPGVAAYGGLLSPQGKILFDFLLFRHDERFLFDIARPAVDDFVKRLTFYRLRSQVEITDLSDERMAVAAWDSSDPPIVDGPVAADPRWPRLGFRALVPPGADMAADFEESTEAAYDAWRIANGIPEGGLDFAFGDTFPHDADMDALGGIDFEKGCFVGQEVVSRMEHRGTARRRIVIVEGPTLPPPGTPIVAGERQVGILGSSADGRGLGLVRLDRAKEAMDAGIAMTAGGHAVALALPPFANFGWPAVAERT